jgi:hypothetical protein
MTSEFFYTDRTEGPAPRVLEEITMPVWQGIAALVERRIADGSLAKEFPLQDCSDSSTAITGTDWTGLFQTLAALIPQLPGPGLNARDLPPTPVVLDLIDFVGGHIASPTDRYQHTYFRHEHLVFDQPESVRDGRQQFRNDVELMFQRNGIAFTLGTDMKVTRLGPPEARQLLSDFTPSTGDSDLDAKLRDALTRFLSRDPQDRVDGLEKLWDAFERVKTLELGPGDKKKSIGQLLDRVAGGSGFRDVLEAECNALTKIGNQFQIRHFEHDRERLPGPSAVDYLFVRLAALIGLLLRETGRM